MPATTQKARAHKVLGLCSVCHREVFPGRARCLYHLFKVVEATQRYRRRHPERKREQRKKEYYHRKANGLCTSCGRVLRDDGGITCVTCTEKYRWNS